MSEPKKIIPASALVDRRRFCEAAGLGVVVIALPACFGDGAGRPIGTGPIEDLDAGQGAPPHDLAGTNRPYPDLAGTHEPLPDLAQGNPPPPDMTTSQGTCPGGYYDTNRAPGAFALNTATYFNAQDAFVCRDGGGLFALSAICPHAGCTVNFKANSTSFHCPCHGANFNYTGGAPTQPAHQPLDHYAICIQNNGDVGFDINTVVASTVRLNA